MLTVIQRVSEAKVEVDNSVNGAINRGILALVAISPQDTLKDIQYTVRKITQMRIFPDEEGKFNYNLVDIKGEILVVSQFTLLGETRKGRRPSFHRAAKPQKAEKVFQQLVDQMKTTGINVETGVFGAQMDVQLTNDGPVTLIVDSSHLH